MRDFQFTPGAERALAFAAGWAVAGAAGELEPPALLLGLLEEPECRAALLLAAAGIGPAQVRERWPELRPHQAAAEERQKFSPAVREALHAAETRLAEYPRPLELATEHLLLGLATGTNEVASWLAERGLRGALEAEIHRLAGHEPGPLRLDSWVSGSQADLATPVGGRPATPTTPLPATEIRNQAAIGAGEQTAVLRMLDAAANRAGEALRVVEDYVRFALDDRLLAAECKSLRHELTAALARFSARDRLAARETRADVGAGLSLPSERSRAGAAAVVAANFQRLGQSLRSLEEWAKTADPDAAAALEAVRYRAYTLERAVGIGAESRVQLAGVRLYVLVDGRQSVADFDRLVTALVTAQAGAIELRDKRLADRELLARARLARERTRATRTLFVMNDRPDLAVLAQADGVHVGQDELPVKDVRSIVGPGMLVGVSTHSLQQAREAVLDGANYIGVGPTFASRTKQFERLAGLELLSEVSAEIGLPAFAIGGIHQANVAQVRACGFTRIAVGSAVVDHANPSAAVDELQRLLE